MELLYDLRTIAGWTRCDYAKLAARAARMGYIDLVRFMIINGADNFEDIACNAAKGGYKDIVEMCIGQRFSAQPAFYHACKAGHQDIVDLLLDKGKEQFEPSADGAVEGRQRKLLAYLLDKGIDDRIDHLAYIAAEHGYIEILEDLIKRGADDFNHIAFVGASYGHRHIVVKAIELGADNMDEIVEAANDAGYPEIADIARKIDECL